MRRRDHASPARSTFASGEARRSASILAEGNFAAGLGAVYGGATVCAWYPITPSTSLAEAFERHCALSDRRDREEDYAFLQAEDEIAAIGMVVGAGWKRRARLHRHLRSRHLADAGVFRPRLFRRSSGRGVRRAARRAHQPACRPGPSSRISCPARSPPTATPSTCCSFPTTPTKCSNSPRGRSISPSDCKRSSSSCSTWTSA